MVWGSRKGFIFVRFLLSFCCLFLLFSYGRISFCILTFLYVKKTHLFSLWLPQCMCVDDSMCMHMNKRKREVH